MCGMNIFAITFMTGAENYTLAAGLYSLQATEMSGSWLCLLLRRLSWFAHTYYFLAAKAYDIRFNSRRCKVN